MERLKNFLFKNSGIRQTVIKNTFWVALGTTLAKIIRVIIIIYLARILGTENYGIFTYVMSLVAIFTLFSDIGLTNILTRELTKRTGEKKEYFSTALVIKLLFLIGTIILIAVFAPLISKFEEAKPLIMIVAITVTLESLRSFFYSITRSQSKMEMEAGLNIITEIITTIIVLGIFLKYPNIKSLAYAYMIGNGIGLLITLIFVREYLTKIFSYFRKHLVRPIIMASWPFAVMGIFSVLMTNIDSVIIAFYSNPHVLGLYAAAQRPISLLYILPGFLSVSLFPIISKFSHGQEKEKLSALVGKSLLISLAMALPIVVGGIITAEPLINVTFGYPFIGAVLTFQILLLSLLFVFPGAIIADLILAEDKQKVFIRSSFFGALTNIILDLALIPIYGIAGSAVATIVALLVVNVILFVEIRKTITFSFFKNIKKMITATIIMGLVTYLLKILSIPLILILIISALIYFGLLLFMKDQIIDDIILTLKTKSEKVS